MNFLHNILVRYSKENSDKRQSNKIQVLLISKRVLEHIATITSTNTNYYNLILPLRLTFNLDNRCSCKRMNVHIYN